MLMNWFPCPAPSWSLHSRHFQPPRLTGKWWLLRTKPVTKVAIFPRETLLLLWEFSVLRCRRRMEQLKGCEIDSVERQCNIKKLTFYTVGVTIFLGWHRYLEYAGFPLSKLWKYKKNISLAVGKGRYVEYAGYPPSASCSFTFDSSHLPVAAILIDQH